MSISEQVIKVLRSRKFWALVIALLTAAGSYATGEMSIWQLCQAVIAALAVYSTGVAIEDMGFKFHLRGGEQK